MSFRLTYATMFDPPAEMHERFDAAVVRVETQLGRLLTQHIDGQDRPAARHAARHSPIDVRLRYADVAIGTAADVAEAMSAAQRAFPAWRALSAAERLRHVRRIGEVLEQRVYDMAAALTIEVGKNRMEALGEAQETVDFFRHYADDYESSGAFDRALPDDPLAGVASHNRSVARPHGVWGVIAPFNFPLALAGGPVAAALVTGNTVVVKGASDTPWAVRLLADCVRDAGLPPGVFNYLLGPGSTVGEALVAHPALAGLTFTGSAEIGRALLTRLAGGEWPRPCIAEMGGKNPCIVTARADLDAAATGIVRSAYGMGGQKCSALSRLYVDEAVAEPLIERLLARIADIRVGDPRRREHWLGPVINAGALASYERCAAQLREGGARVLAGGTRLGEGALAHGHYVTPLLAEAPSAHPLWRHEMFLPILMLQRVPDRETAMQLANDTPLGLTAGFYGGADEVPWFHEHIEAGVTYANRPQGATTGAWPGYQPFGGWKGSSSTGKGIASFYYLAQYLREQSRTVVERHR